MTWSVWSRRGSASIARREGDVLPQRLDKIASHYLFSGVFGALTGLLSYSILTRALSPEAYGQLGLLSTAVAFAAGFAKLGLQHAVIRFFRHPETLFPALSKVDFHYSLHTLMLLTSVLAAVFLWPVLSYYHGRLDQLGLGVMLILVASAMLKVQLSFYINTRRALEQSRSIMWSQLLEKALRIVLLLIVVWLEWVSVFSALLLALLTEMLQCVWLGRAVKVTPEREEAGRWRASIVPPLLLFGVPLMAKELLHLVLDFGDRFLIERFLGSADLGRYAAVYNLCLYLDWTVIAALFSALMPRLVHLSEAKDFATLSALLRSVTHGYVIFAALVLSGALLLGPSVVWLLAGERYAQDAQWLLVLIVLGILFNGALQLAGLSLFIHKATGTLLGVNAVAALLNVGLNLWWIPQWGLLGAALSTAVCFLIALLLMLYLGRTDKRYVPVLDHWPSLAAAGFAVGLSVLAVELGMTLWLRAVLLVGVGILLAVSAQRWYGMLRQ